MWGFKNSQNRTLAKDIYKLIVDKRLGQEFNPTGQSPKGYDQSFLSNHVYKSIKQNSIIHDSFLCTSYQDSQPFPTKRKGDCFVGQVGTCNETGHFYECPKECRPKDHLDWNSC